MDDNKEPFNAIADMNDTPNEDEDAKTKGSTSEEDEEEVYEVEKIVKHKKEGGIDYYQIRWVGYEPKDDTWEPEGHLIGDATKLMIEKFWTERKNTIEKVKETRKMKRDSKDANPIIVLSESDEEDHDESWYGIKPDEEKGERRRLFVQDRVLTPSEKFLADVKPGERVLRHQLKDKLTPTNSQSSNEAPKPMPKKTVTPIKLKKRQGSKGTPLYERVLKKKPKLETDSEDVSAGSKFNQEGKATQRKKKKRKMSSPLEFESGPSGSKIYGSNIPKTFSVSTHVESCPIKSKQEFSSSLLAKKEKNQNDKVVTNKKPVKVSDSLVTTHQGILPNLHKKPKKNEGIMDANTCHSQQTKKTKKKLQLPMQDKKEFIQGCGRIMRDRLLAENFDLPIPLLSCNNSANNISELISKLKKSVLSVPTNRTLSQQEFEEAVIDSKVNKCRDALSGGSIIDVNLQNSAGQTLLHRLCEIDCKASHSQCELIDILVNNGARMDIRDRSGRIPLHIAIGNQKYCLIRKLLQLHSPVNMEDSGHRSPIILALECREDIFESLLRAGSSFHTVFEKLRGNNSPANSSILRILSSHKRLLSDAFDAARNIIIASNVQIRTISQIFVNPLNDAEEFNQSFRSDGCIADQNHCFIVMIALADFMSEKVEAKMWGHSPIASVSVNGEECTLLPPTKFVYLCTTKQSYNYLKIKLNPSFKKSDIKMLSCVASMQLLPTSKPTFKQ